MKAQNVWNCPWLWLVPAGALLIVLYSAVWLSISVTEWLFKSALVDHAGTHPCPWMNIGLIQLISYIIFVCIYRYLFTATPIHCYCAIYYAAILIGHITGLFAICPVPAHVETQNQCEQGMSNWFKGHGKGLENLDCATLGRWPHTMSAPGWNIFLVFFFVDLWTNLGIDARLFLMRKSELRLLNCN